MLSNSKISSGKGGRSMTTWFTTGSGEGWARNDENPTTRVLSGVRRSVERERGSTTSAMETGEAAGW